MDVPTDEEEDWLEKMRLKALRAMQGLVDPTSSQLVRLENTRQKYGDAFGPGDSISLPSDGTTWTLDGAGQWVLYVPGSVTLT